MAKAFTEYQQAEAMYKEINSELLEVRPSMLAFSLCVLRLLLLCMCVLLYCIRLSSSSQQSAYLQVLPATYDSRITFIVDNLQNLFNSQSQHQTECAKVHLILFLLFVFEILCVHFSGHFFGKSIGKIVSVQACRRAVCPLLFALKANSRGA